MIFILVSFTEKFRDRGNLTPIAITVPKQDGDTCGYN
jgi:hypothetical protein